MSDDVWTYADVARFFKKAERTVRRWPLPRLAVPGHPRFDPEAVKRWAENRDASRRRFTLERGA